MPRPGIKQQQLDQHHQADENVDLDRVADEVVAPAERSSRVNRLVSSRARELQMVRIVQAALSGPPQEKRRTRRQQQRYCANG